LVETDDVRFLVDCGMFQGGPEARQKNMRALNLGFDVRQIDFVLLTHAHIDHSGLLPRLSMLGYRGPIYTTQATADLLAVLLPDSGHIQEKEAEWQLRHRHRRGKDERGIAPPLYTVAQALASLKLLRPVHYGETLRPAESVSVTFHNAGHILGSAIVEMQVQDHHLQRHLVFSGDLGNTCSPLMQAPTQLNQADVLLMESTYGDRDHRPSDETLEELADILQQAHKEGGNVLIPSFAVGRTQDLIYYLGRFYQEGRLPQQAVFLDSPMAIRANAIYSRFHDQFAATDRAALAAKGIKRVEDWLPVLRCTPTAEESMAINRIKSGAIIIAGSGMCTGGRIVHHFKHNLWRSECHLVFPGFQAAGTLGRNIVDGAPTVRLLHQRIAVKAKVHTLGGFSAHAGQSQLIDWVSHFDHHPELYLVHGELEKMKVLQGELKSRLNWDANIPEPGEQIVI